jgi:branched-chain amino acid transport system ATP-binding protein
MLDVDNVEVRYGAIRALKGISFHVNEGEIVALLGANGAGKTTVLRAVMGLVRNRRGSIVVGGTDISDFPTHRIASGHAAIAPEGRRLFTDLTVEDNLILGALHLRRDRPRVQALLASVYALFPVLKAYRRRRSAFLSGGEQQMVAIGRMLMSDPEILLLDEPSIALSPVAVEIVARALMALRERGASLLLVEQRVDVAAKVCDRLYVLRHGEIV